MVKKNILKIPIYKSVIYAEALTDFRIFCYLPFFPPMNSTKFKLTYFPVSSSSKTALYLFPFEEVQFFSVTLPLASSSEISAAVYFSADTLVLPPDEKSALFATRRASKTLAVLDHGLPAARTVTQTFLTSDPHAVFSAALNGNYRINGFLNFRKQNGGAADTVLNIGK